MYLNYYTLGLDSKNQGKYILLEPSGHMWHVFTSPMGGTYNRINWPTMKHWRYQGPMWVIEAQKVDIKKFIYKGSNTNKRYQNHH